LLNYTLHQRDKGLSINFRGAVDEKAASVLSELLGRLSVKDIVLDMKRVESFNLLGIGAWAGFIKQLSAGRRLAYTHCPPDFVNQIKILPLLAHGVSILSFTAEFICLDCHQSQRESFDATQSKTDLMAAFEKVSCIDCGNNMFPDEDPETILYFKNPKI
jgi:anti-anti-sigma regulatory factor